MTTFSLSLWGVFLNCPWTVQVKQFLFVSSCLPSFSSHPILLVFVESSEVKCNSIRWLLPRGLWCSFSSCLSLSHPHPPPPPLPYAMLRSRPCIIVIVMHAYWTVMGWRMHLNVRFAHSLCFWVHYTSWLFQWFLRKHFETHYYQIPMTTNVSV